jgi:AraC-like DNA-binding protein
MIIRREVILSNDRREIIDTENEGIMYQCLCNYLDQFEEGRVPWHWHEELEVAYVTSGEFDYSFPEQKARLRKGDFVFINSNVLHGIFPENNDLTGCSMYVIQFAPGFLAGGYNSDIARKYFLPLIGCSSIPYYVFSPEGEKENELIYDFNKAYYADLEGGYGHEFRVQNHLSKLWLNMFKMFEPILEKAGSHNDASMDRLKVMMSYIQNNYHEKLTLDDIAGSANISSRECSRCFSTNLAQSPIDYLNNYRTERAAHLLISGNKSILDISEECGFSSGSYFSKMFGRIMDCTPMEYRKKNRKTVI